MVDIEPCGQLWQLPCWPLMTYLPGTQAAVGMGVGLAVGFAVGSLVGVSVGYSVGYGVGYGVG